MKKYKTELHCHTRDASACSNMSAEATVERYLEYGYSTIVLTNHFGAFATMMDQSQWLAHCEKTFRAYDNMVAASGGRLNILLGMEARFEQNGNDYLVYGGFDRGFLEDYGGGLLKLGIRDFSVLIHKRGGFISQAHPFRYGSVTTQPGYLDGIEVFNGHFKHDSHNDIANAWADHFGMIKTSGTDHHDDDHYPDGGIATDEPITTIDQLITTLRAGNYDLVRDYPYGKPKYDKFGQFLGLIKK